SVVFSSNEGVRISPLSPASQYHPDRSRQIRQNLWPLLLWLNRKIGNRFSRHRSALPEMPRSVPIHASPHRLVKTLHIILFANEWGFRASCFILLSVCSFGR